MSTSTRQITSDELFAMPNNARRELVRGEVREMAPAGSNHGLAVEVISPDDTLEEVQEKVDDYLSAGTRMVVVITPRRKTLTVYQAGANPVILRHGGSLEGGDVVPDFCCPVADIFI